LLLELSGQEDTMLLIEKKINLAILVGTRGFFNPELALSGRRALLKKLDRMNVSYVIPEESATQTGAVEDYEDAKIWAECIKGSGKEIHGVVVVLPNFGNELGVVNGLKMAGLDVPVLVQACNDENDKVGVKERRDAFCGKLSVCNNLYQYGFKFTDTGFHTCDIDGDEFSRDLSRFIAVCRTVSGLRNARIGAIGARPGAFQTVRFSEKILQKTGITVVPVDLSEILAAAGKLDPEASIVKQKRQAIGAYGRIPNTIPESMVMRQTLFSVAVEEFMNRNELDASAIQCWESMQKNYGCASCLTMSMMGEQKRPSACEMDISGAVSMYTLLLASGNSPGFLDWNNNFDYAKDKCVGTHCSNYPKSFMGNDIEISNLDVLGGTLGQENCFGAIKGKVAPGDFTFFRISTDDTKGIIKSYLGEGVFTDDPYNMDGGIAVCKVDRVNDLMKYLCRNGFEHHVAMVRGQVADVIEEAVGNYLGWDLYRHG
jgi:L-fucose isomerase-like protein